MVSTEQWQSKLGHSYPKAEIDRLDKTFHEKLNKIRTSSANRKCADCLAEGTVWAIVNHGTFVCLHCASLHRSLGTHISKPKGCTGTYLWGPDEMQRMEDMGNARAQLVYGGAATRPAQSASDETWKQWLCDRYEHRKWYNESPPSPAKPKPTADSVGSGLSRPSSGLSRPSGGMARPSGGMARPSSGLKKVAAKPIVAQPVADKAQPTQQQPEKDLISFDGEVWAKW
eukprot:NODE_1537_length_915_cov_134.662818_g1194_i0.p1 GENE.NODE_1537_length_915_cov_134.662818_g1194_i0~~NODE_1537_length_915_cov_134.662818_g1194_i0.p1  ORF type:complete len:247 (+),score=77.51 NODE_1537_length_915_cov_134.662818_g1194_i0:58-741(+)